MYIHFNPVVVKKYILKLTSKNVLTINAHVFEKLQKSVTKFDISIPVFSKIKALLARSFLMMINMYTNLRF